MIDVIKDTLVDALKVFPFLVFAFLIIELVEHKFSEKAHNIISTSGKFGPVLGGLLGIIPQCGFSIMGTNLYITRIISLGSLFSIYLSTSDEMIPIMLSSSVSFIELIKIIFIKFLLAIVWGFIIDFIFTNFKEKRENYEICDHDKCHCEDGILKSVVHHTINTFLFILISTFLLNIIMYYFGEDTLSNLLFKNSALGSFITSLIGLIPNCGASVIITELYLSGVASMGALIGGLLTGSGIALLVLFRENKNIKENIMILSLLYLIGSISGLLIDVISLLL